VIVWGIEILVLFVLLGFLVYAGVTRQRRDTISELVWSVRAAARLHPVGMTVFVVSMSITLGWVWWHFVFD
jgi:hypothetical protein